MMMMTEEEGEGRIRCEDCGNQAKRNCVYMRCRTCCKRRGFQCHTHIKSTWIPAYVRRQKHLQEQHHHHLNLLSVQQQNPKPSSSGLDHHHQVGNFPAETRTEATFRCVRVSSVDDGIDQYAYHTSVSIGGHIFKGILYDQGPQILPETSSINDQQPPAANTVINVNANTETLPPPPPSYAFPFNPFMSGTQFFPHPKS